MIQAGLRWGSKNNNSSRGPGGGPGLCMHPQWHLRRRFSRGRRPQECRWNGKPFPESSENPIQLPGAGMLTGSGELGSRTVQQIQVK